MGKINLLDSSIYNHISAGEVVTNPAAVVKELVENSIDAGADRITIEIEGGGISKIRVIDNGSGIQKDDVQKAFLSHATSKISAIDDIYKISTLGFRGEALASIGAVSKANITTKTHDSEVGTFLDIDGGVFGECKEIGTTDGTSITVTNLFYNTPARLKFLRQPRYEQAEINKLVARFILGHPELNITYLVDGEIFYQSQSGTLSDAIYAIYGAEFLEEMIKVNKVENGVRLTGYISTPFGCKNSTSWQNTYVNGRWVDSKCVSLAAYNAYSDFIMKGKFPVFVLNIEMDPRDVDINVSPQKTEVKFVKDGEMFAFIYKTIMSVLVQNERDTEEKEALDRINSAPVIEPDNIRVNVNSFKACSIEPSQTNVESPSVSIDKNTDKAEHINDTTVKIFDSYNKSEEPPLLKRMRLNSTTGILSEAMKADFDRMHRVIDQNGFLEDDPFTIMGVAFKTYIIVESNNTLYFIDQHAAHERLLYDKFFAEIDNGEIVSQPLLVPHIIKTSYEESAFLNEYMDIISSLGFEMESFGVNTFKILSVPKILINLDIDYFFNDIFIDLTYLVNHTKVIKDKIASKACRFAVKAGDKLSNEEIDILLKQVKQSKTTLLCPHGRPFVIKIEQSDIQKWFKRTL